MKQHIQRHSCNKKQEQDSRTAQKEQVGAKALSSRTEQVITAAVAPAPALASALTCVAVH